MGLLGDLFKNRKLDDPVHGTFQVMTSSQMPHGATSGNVRLMGVVQGDGVPPTSVEHHCIARTSKWPHSGALLPVLVDRSDPTSFKILWDEVGDGWEQARARADAAAQAQQGPAAGGPSEEVLEMLRARGIAIPPGAQVSVVQSSGTIDPGAAARQGAEDPAERLRRLDGLRDAGLVTADEYREQRARILADL